ncbi:MAG: YqiA/YcfP family alpha/beta fold hydrolase [Polyangiales bacterium]
MSTTNSSSPVHLAYAHGFGSSPQSSKAIQIQRALAARGVRIELPDLRVPSPGGLRLTAMMAAIGEVVGERGRLVVVGSSLGALAAARAAERDSRIVGALLLAPAFCLVERWHARLGDAAWTAWREKGTSTFVDYSGPDLKFELEWKFIEECVKIDGPDAPLDDEGKAGRGARWPDVRVPVTIVHGRRDEVVDPQLSRLFSRDRENVRLVEVDDDHQLGHSVPRILDELDRLVERVR